MMRAIEDNTVDHTWIDAALHAGGCEGLGLTTRDWGKPSAKFIT